ncbi:conserved hypothetical protein [Candidatus Sulfopaludibacter sp. SbA4]|nr:conserved hypothetical protein [Candidatus Sulfopaludibacter sp. SbA4]
MQRLDLHSTSLRTVAYQDQRALLELEFRSGAVYRYFGVPAESYQALLRSESKGGYFNSHIRNRFAYAKIYPAGQTPVRDSNS